MREITIKVYSFNELADNIQVEVVSEAILFILDCYNDGKASEGMKKAVKEAMGVQAPLLTLRHILECCRQEILEYCRKFEYEEDGSFRPK